jgi:glycosyltransferase involved in cell wall biosynthesis
MMEAAAYLRRRGGPPVRLLMFKSFLPGEGFSLEQATGVASSLGVDAMIEWHDPVPFHDMFQLMRTCDLGTIAYTRNMGVNCMPNRIFEYMALGLPVVCPDFARELVPILNETKCGILADTEKGEALGKAIFALCSDQVAARGMGSAGRRAFQDRYNMEQELQPFVDWVIGGLKHAR